MAAFQRNHQLYTKTSFFIPFSYRHSFNKSNKSIKRNEYTTSLKSLYKFNNSEFLLDLKDEIKSFHNVKRLDSSWVHSPRFKQRMARERIYTQTFIDKLNSDTSTFRNAISKEVESAYRTQHLLGQTSNYEMGPSGLYTYFYNADGNYMRQKISFQGSKNDNQLEEIVLESTIQLVGPMSLSYDEEYISYLCLKQKITNNNKSQTIMKTKNSNNEEWNPVQNCVLVVRHISSTNEFILPFHQYPFESNHSISNVEFGAMTNKPFHSENDIYSLYFTTYNNMNRPDSIWYCQFQQNQFSIPKLIMNDENEAHFLDIARTKGGKYMVINSTSKTSNEVYLLEMNPKDPCQADVKQTMENDYMNPKLKLVRTREDGIQYFVECGTESNEIYILAYHTLDIPDAMHSYDLDYDISIFKTSMEELPLPSDFGQKIHPYNRQHDTNEKKNKKTFIEEIDLFDRFMVLYERHYKNGTQQIRVVPKDDKKVPYKISIPSDPLGHYPTLIPGGNIFYPSTKLQFTASSLLIPSLSYECDMETGVIQQIDAMNVLSYSKEALDIPYQEYQQTRVLITSSDGTQVPLTLVYKKQETIHNHILENIGNGDRPTLLLGYGAYGVSQDPSFDPTFIPLLSRGWVIAFAHTRGGGELGKKWYTSGKQLKKKNSIEDYIACAQALTNEDGLNVTMPHKLAGRGVSAGGVIVASAAMIQKPELFGAVILKSPFLDVLGTMMDKSLPLTEHEFGEWGDPSTDEHILKAISQYCPYLNLGNCQNRNLPNVLLIGALDDNHVPPWNSLSFAMKARELVQDKPIIQDNQSYRNRNESSRNNILLHMEELGGHNLHANWLDIASLEVSFLHGCISQT